MLNQHEVAQAQTERFIAEHAQANSQQLQENRFIKIGYGPSGIDVVNAQNNLYLQYHYDLSDNSKIGYATPTTVITITKDDLKNWNDISEIR